MPTITNTPQEGYAHCLEPRCAGYQQQKVAAVKRETAWLYTELDGDMPGFERSQVGYHFADEDQAPCPTCGGPREIAPEPRTDYAGIIRSGRDPMALIGYNPNTPDIASLQAEIEALKAKVGDAA